MAMGIMHGDNGRVRQRADCIVPNEKANASTPSANAGSTDGRISYDDIAGLMTRSHDRFERAIGEALAAGTETQRRSLEGAFNNLFVAYRIGVAAEREHNQNIQRAREDYKKSLEAAGISMYPFA